MRLRDCPELYSVRPFVPAYEMFPRSLSDD
jgi:hypothetical protein